MGKLTAVSAKALVKAGQPGRYGDGEGVYLHVTSADSAKWEFRYKVAGRLREMGLGAFDTDGERGVTLAGARAKASALRDQLRNKVDPLEQRRLEAEARARAAAESKAVTEALQRTFKQVAEQYIGAHEAGWRNAKHQQQWVNTLETYADPHIGELPVSAIETEHVLKVLEPIWTSKSETATRVRGRIEAVLAYATVRGWRSGPNPAQWRSWARQPRKRPPEQRLVGDQAGTSSTRRRLPVASA